MRKKKKFHKARALIKEKKVKTGIKIKIRYNFIKNEQRKPK